MGSYQKRQNDKKVPVSNYLIKCHPFTRGSSFIAIHFQSATDSSLLISDNCLNYKKYSMAHSISRRRKNQGVEFLWVLMMWLLLTTSVFLQLTVQDSNSQPCVMSPHTERLHHGTTDYNHPTEEPRSYFSFLSHFPISLLLGVIFPDFRVQRRFAVLCWRVC